MPIMRPPNFLSRRLVVISCFVLLTYLLCWLPLATLFPLDNIKQWRSAIYLDEHYSSTETQCIEDDKFTRVVLLAIQRTINAQHGDLEALERNLENIAEHGVSISIIDNQRDVMLVEVGFRYCVTISNRYGPIGSGYHLYVFSKEQSLYWTGIGRVFGSTSLLGWAEDRWVVHARSCSADGRLCYSEICHIRLQDGDWGDACYEVTTPSTYLLGAHPSEMLAVDGYSVIEFGFERKGSHSCSNSFSPFSFISGKATVTWTDDGYERSEVIDSISITYLQSQLRKTYKTEYFNDIVDKWESSKPFGTKQIYTGAIVRVPLYSRNASQPWTKYADSLCSFSDEQKQAIEQGDVFP